MKSTYLGRSCRSLPAACRRRDVLEVPLPRYSRIEVLDNGLKLFKALTRIFNGAKLAARTLLLSRSRGAARPSAGALQSFAEDGTRSQ